MSNVVAVESAAQFQEILKSSRIVVTNFFNEKEADHAIAPYFDGLSEQLSRDKAVSFVRINIGSHQDIATTYGVTATPTFVLFCDGRVLDRAQGANPNLLKKLMAKLMTQMIMNDAEDGEGSGGSGSWLGAALPRGYVNITAEIEVARCELLNIDPDAGSVRVLFAPVKPVSGSAVVGSNNDKDWIESDTDEQVMLFVPFMSTVKVHTLQITSCPGAQDEAARPRLIKLFSNSPHNMGFDEAEDTVATQEIELTEADWNKEGTASISLRFVKFQKVNSLVMFVVSAEGDAEKVRLDRVRLIGDAGEKREMGKLEKIGHEMGE